LKQESDKGSDMMSNRAFEVAAANINSEILKFRAQVGPYRVEEKNQIAMQKPINCLSLKLKNIWMALKPFLNEDGLEIPSSFWEFDPDVAEGAIPEPSERLDLVQEDKNFLKKILKLKPLSRFLKKKNTSSETETLLDEVPVDETTPLHVTLPDYGKTPSKEVSLSIDEPSTIVIVPEVIDEEDPLDEVFVDDNFSPLKADDYIESRMQTQMNQKVELIGTMASRNFKLGFAIKLVTLFSGATAALSLQWCVPIILGVTASLGTGQEFRKYPKRIEAGNAMVVQLNELKLWWMGLSMYQKQLPHNKDKLILTAERLIVHETESSFDVPTIEKAE
jgi:hypothetical protein